MQLPKYPLPDSTLTIELFEASPKNGAVRSLARYEYSGADHVLPLAGMRYALIELDTERARDENRSLRSHMLDLETGEVTALLARPSNTDAVAWVAESSRLFYSAVMQDGCVGLMTQRPGREPDTLTKYPRGTWISDVAVSRDGSRLIYTRSLGRFSMGCVELFDMHSGRTQPLRRYGYLDHVLTMLSFDFSRTSTGLPQFSPDGRFIILAPMIAPSRDKETLRSVLEIYNIP